MNGKTIELCRPCAEARRAEGQALAATLQGVDRKIRCADCGRRRYGGAYRILREGRDEHERKDP